MRTAAGVLEIIAGVFNILIAVTLIIVGIFFPAFVETWSEYYPYYDFNIVNFTGAILVVFAIIFAVPGILSVIGGIFALRKKLWGLALTGGILALFPFVLLGILSIVFVAVTKKEFDEVVINSSNIVS